MGVLSKAVLPELSIHIGLQSSYLVGKLFWPSQGFLVLFL